MLIQFKLNKTLDKKLINEFLNTSVAGVDFSESVIKLHPDLKKVKSLNYNEKLEFISKYVEYYYNYNTNNIKKKLIEIQTRWNKIEKKYFEEIRKVFGIKRAIRKQYIAYISIINACPRWTSKKEFCIGYNLNEKNNLLTICHELTHFFFYEYMNKKYPKSLDNQRKWIFSEIFNVIILNKPQFRELFKPLKEEGYPAHEKYFDEFKRLYHCYKNIDEFLKKGIKVIKGIESGSH